MCCGCQKKRQESGCYCVLHRNKIPGSTEHPINPPTYVPWPFYLFSFQENQSVGKEERSLKSKLRINWHEGSNWCAHLNAGLGNIWGHCLGSHEALPGNTRGIRKLLHKLSFPLPFAKLKSKRSVVKRPIQLLLKNLYL